MIKRYSSGLFIYLFMNIMPAFMFCLNPLYGDISKGFYFSSQKLSSNRKIKRNNEKFLRVLLLLIAFYFKMCVM